MKKTINPFRMWTINPFRMWGTWVGSLIPFVLTIFMRVSYANERIKSKTLLGELNYWLTYERTNIIILMIFGFIVSWIFILWYREVIK